MESIVFSDVAVIADAAHNQDGDFLLIAGVEYPVSLHFRNKRFFVNALETFKYLRITNQQFSGCNRRWRNH